jgi:hypothetical protein
MARELDAARFEQNVRALPVKRFARRIPMQGLRPSLVRILMTTDAPRSWNKVFGGNQLAVFGSRIRRTEGLCRNRRHSLFVSIACGSSGRAASIGQQIHGKHNHERRDLQASQCSQVDKTHFDDLLFPGSRCTFGFGSLGQRSANRCINNVNSKPDSSDTTFGDLQ